jgi:hypothetical protein
MAIEQGREEVTLRKLILLELKVSPKCLAADIASAAH